MPLRESMQQHLGHKVLADVDMFEQLIYELVHHSAGGVGSLAGRMGYTGAESLINEVCQTNKQAKFGALELFVALLKVPTRDRERFMQSLTDLLGVDCPRKGGDAFAPSQNLMVMFAALGKEQNEVNTALFEALADDAHIDTRERAHLVSELDDVIKAAANLKVSLLQGAKVVDCE